MNSMKKDFSNFLKDYNVLGMAIGVVIGGAVGKLISSLVNDLLMPFLEILTPGGSWRTLAWKVAGAEFKVGNFLGALVDFLIIAFVIYLVVKKILKLEELPGKKSK
jgi:large conductance mechanosensitive channel